MNVHLICCSHVNVVNVCYRERIKEPMDLGTISQRVASRFYYGNDHCRYAKDVNLVWSNCATYNMEGSEICIIAQRYLMLMQ